MMLSDYNCTEYRILGVINFRIPQKLIEYKAKEKNSWGGFVKTVQSRIFFHNEMLEGSHNTACYLEMLRNVQNNV